MDRLKLEIRGKEPRQYKGKTSWFDLTETEKQQFTEKRIQAVKDSTVPQYVKQGIMLSGSISGLSTAAAFERYVNQEDQWYL